MKKQLLILFYFVSLFALGSPSKQIPTMDGQWWLSELITSVSEMLDVNEAQAPTVDFTYSIDDLCKGTTVSFTSDISYETGNLTYDWDFGDSSTHSNVPNPTHVYDVNGCANQDYTVTLSVTDDDGTSIADEIITVSPLLQLDFHDPSVSNQANAFNNCGSTNPVYSIEVENQSTSVPFWRQHSAPNPEA